MNAPKIDPRTYRELVAQAETLASAYTAMAEPTLAALTGRVLRQDVTIPGQTLPAGTLITPDLAATLSSAPDIAAIPVVGWSYSKTLEVAPTVANLSGRILDQTLILIPMASGGYALGDANPANLPAGTRLLEPGCYLDEELAGVLASIKKLTQVRIKSWQEPARANLQPDAGLALIRIFAHFAELLIDRINRAADKNFLAFLNLIGTELLPPQPARVPLTFQLAENSPVDAAVPAGVQAAAPPSDGEENEAIFTTDRALIVTRAQLQAVFVRDSESDRYSDRTAQASGQVDEPFAVFYGDRPLLHQFYVACDELLTKPGAKDFTLTIYTPKTWQWQNWPITWSYWNGVDWRQLNPQGTASNVFWRLTFSQLPSLPISAVHEVEAGWLRAQLELPLPPDESGNLPDALASGNRNPQPPAGIFQPFSDSSIRRFYLSATDTFASGGALIHIQVKLAQSGVAQNLQLTWSYKVGDQWIALGQSSSTAERVGTSPFDLSDGTRALTRSGEISFHAPLGWPAELYRTRTGRWLRVEIMGDGQYSTLPQIESFSLSYTWELPSITAISARLDKQLSALAPEVAFYNASLLDLSKDLLPFGEQPRYNDAFYLALPTAVARPGQPLKVQLTLTNPQGATNAPVPVVYSGGSVQLAWEVWDGQRWQVVTGLTSASPDATGKLVADDGPKLFTKSGEVTLVLPGSLAPTAVNGEEQLWLRVRLVGGHYGEVASYRPKSDAQGNVTGYTFSPATLAPPMIQKLTLMPLNVENKEVALSACLSYNDFQVQVYQPAVQPPAVDFLPFTASADSEPALYLGFDQPFDPRPVTLYLQVEPPLPDEVAADQLAETDPAQRAHVTWEYSAPTGWQPLAALDETETLASRGMVHFIGPSDLIARSSFGYNLYWVRARWVQGEFPLSPRLRRVLPNTIWATQVTAIEGEILGSGNGEASQRFVTAQVPVQPGQALLVREPDLPTAAEEAALRSLEGDDAITVTTDAVGQPDEIWVRWHAVADFYDSGPNDRHYRIDPLSGSIQFGDGKAGLLPPQGQNNIRISYRAGGGEAGNRPARTIVELKSGVPYVDGVINHEAAQGGAEREPMERLKARGPRLLRHRNRAITAQDLEDLALAASPEVARAAAIVPTFDPYALWLDPTIPADVTLAQHSAVAAGRMGVIVVPNSTAAQPTPSLSLLRQVQGYLAARCPATADLWVAGPEWIAVKVKATVVPYSLDAADAVAGRVSNALTRFLHPLTGGVQGTGWAFGRNPHHSDLYALVEGVDGVDHVHTLHVELVPESPDAARNNELNRLLTRPLNKSNDPVELEEDLQRWLNRALIYSGKHEITVVFGA